MLQEALDVTFTTRYGVIPVSADSMQTGERWLSKQSVTHEALKGNGHPHAVVLTNHNTITKRSGVRTPLQLICWEEKHTVEQAYETMKFQE